VFITEYFQIKMNIVASVLPLQLERQKLTIMKVK